MLAIKPAKSFLVALIAFSFFSIFLHSSHAKMRLTTSVKKVEDGRSIKVPKSTIASIGYECLDLDAELISCYITLKLKDPIQEAQGNGYVNYETIYLNARDMSTDFGIGQLTELAALMRDKKDAQVICKDLQIGLIGPNCAFIEVRRQ